MGSSLTFTRFIGELNSLISKKSRLLVAVSGGIDSVTLLHLTSRLKLEYDIYAVHINHGLRDASDSEENFVHNLCHNFDIALTVHQAKKDIAPNESMEMWARRIRQKSFELARNEFQCDFILTAHHANDNVETILMHLDDGCGIEGVRGIPQQNGSIIRPLLKFSRRDIEKYARHHRLNYMEDESNSDTSIKRNFVRHKVMKPWENQTNEFIDRFISLSQKATDVVDRMNKIIIEISANIEDRNHQKIINDDLVKKITTNQMVRLIKHILGETEISWRRHQWEALNQWLKSPKIGSILKLSKQWTILRDRDCFIINHEIQKKINMDINKQGQFGSDGFSFSLSKIDSPSMDSNPFHEVIDAEYVNGKKLVLRSWRKGDRFTPMGMNGRKKVSDLLVDKKVNRFSKENQLVLTADDEIIWVCGLRLNDNAKVTQSTTEFLELNIESFVG